MITWPCHMIWLSDLPCYLYLDPIVRLDVRDQLCECMGNSFLLGALITRHFLEGATYPVEIWTDHKNLEYFMTAKKLNCQQACWSLHLARFDFLLHHCPRRTMGKLDALSRRANHGNRASDNENIVLLRPEFLAVCVSASKVQWLELSQLSLCSEFDKENLIEFPLDFLYYLYNYYMVCALFSHTYHVTHHMTSCDVTLWLPVMWLWLCDTCDVTLSCTSFCVVSPR